MEIKVPVEVSARHVHLKKEDVIALFGSGHRLKVLRLLTQPRDFAAEEILDIEVGGKTIKGLRVVGPERTASQVEVSLTDAISLGIDTPVRMSGDLTGSAPITLIGPAGRVNLLEGLIIAMRHLHCNPEQAKKLKLRNGQIVAVKTGSREVIFKNIPVRIGEGYNLCLHLDTDEGNAAGINRKGEGILLKKIKI